MKLKYFLTAQNSKKNDGLELYRIFSMIFIILFHFSDHGAVKISADMPLTINWMLMAFFRCWGALGNCAFVFITGYFMIEKKQNFKRLLKLWFQVWIFSISIGFVCFTFGIVQFSWGSLIKMLFPVIFNEYWYMSSYVILFLISPFLNKCLLSLNQDNYKKLLIVLLCVFSIVPTFTGVKWMTDQNFIASFILSYCIGGYIRRFNIQLFRKAKTYFACAIVLTLGMFLSIIVFKLLHLERGLFYFVWGMNKFSVIITALMWFMGFLQLENLHGNRIIYWISSSIFGVYLLHIGRLNTWIFGSLFNTQKTYFLGTVPLISQLVLGTLTILTAGILIDKIRLLLCERLVFPLVKQINNKILRKI